MARLAETVATVKISRLVKDGEVISQDIDNDLLEQLEVVLAELAGAGAMIEVIRQDA